MKRFRLNFLRHNKIARKLTLYFAAALLAFAVLIGSVFFFLFQQHTIKIAEEQLERRASGIAETMANYIEGSQEREFPPPDRMRFANYIHNLSELAMADVWIVDSNLNIFTPAEAPGKDFRFSSLPPNAEKLIRSAFSGTTTVSESFNSVLTAKALTVGTPIVNSDGETVGVVLLHSPISGTEAAAREGSLILLISISVALGISIALAVVFSLTFTKPLKIMKQTALQLAEGDYTVKTNIRQKDEIGELAHILDGLSVRLLKASQESEKLEAVRREYVANISHELKTPITVIRGSLEALCDGIITEPEMVKEYHDQMLAESKGLQRLVGDLLDLSRLQNVDFAIEMTRVNLCEVLADIDRSCKNLAQDKRVEVRLSMPEQPCMVTGDYGRLRQLFMIIADNAVKFSHPGGEVHIRMRAENEKIRLTITDRGKGIAPEELAHIFERFYKTKSPENVSGTGLGLAIAKEIALRHNALLSADSSEREGTVFTLVFLAEK